MPYFHNEDINLLFIHIPKTGGTSVQTYLSRKFEIEMNHKSMYGWNHPDADHQILFGDDSQEYSMQHLSYRRIVKLEHLFGLDVKDSKLTVFAVLRNPYDRIISDIFFFVELGIHELSTSKEVEMAIEFYLSSPNNFDNHRMTQYDMLKDEDGNIPPNIILLRTETLAIDMHHLGFDDFNLVENKNRAHINQHNYKALLTPRSIALIDAYYEKDFILIQERFGKSKL